MALRPGRYIAHFIGLASDGKPIYAAYCCVPEPPSDSDLPSFDSVSESTSDSGSWDSYPPSSYPDSGGSAPSGVPCTDCLARLCVVRDDTGRIVDIYYYTDDGDQVRVPDCGYYGSAPSSSGSSGGSSGGGGGGGGGGCCPQNGSNYVLEYDFVVSGRTFSGVSQSLGWMWGIIGWSFTIPNPPCDDGPPPLYLFMYFSARCENGNIYPSVTLVCGTPFCTLNPSDFAITVTGCPGNPTIYLTILPGRCASGSFVLRPV